MKIVQQPSNDFNFEQIYIENWQRIAQIAYRYTCNMETSEDLAQNVFINLHDKVREGIIILNPPAYLSVSIKNECLRHIDISNRIRLAIARSHGSLLEIKKNGKIVLGTDQLNVLEDVTPDREAAVLNALNQLSERRKIAFALRHINKIPVLQIAALMKISKNSIKTHLKLAKSQIKKSCGL